MRNARKQIAGAAASLALILGSLAAGATPAHAEADGEAELPLAELSDIETQGVEAQDSVPQLQEDETERAEAEQEEASSPAEGAAAASADPASADPVPADGIPADEAPADGAPAEAAFEEPAGELEIAAKSGYSDVKPSDAFYGEIMWLQSSGIATGWPDGTFRPHAAVTRDAFAAFLYRLKGSPSYRAPAVSRFKDVSVSHPFYKEISWAAEKGIAKGWADGTYRPLEPISRDAMAAFLYRYSGSPSVTASNTYWDVSPEHPFAKEITWMSKAGISCGWTDGTYRPLAATERSAMAAFLYRFVTGTRAECPARIYDISSFAMPWSVARMVQLQQAGSSYDAKKSAAALQAMIDPGSFQVGSGQFLQFADLRVTTGTTSAQINSFLASTSTGRKGNLAGLGYIFVDAGRQYGLNETFLVALAVYESGWGTSELAKGYYYDGKTPIGGRYYPAGTYYNFYGIGAVDSSPLSGGRAMAIKSGWNSREKAIKGAAQWISTNYVRRTADAYAQPNLYAMKWDYQRAAATGSYGWHQYSTVESWAEHTARLMGQCYSFRGGIPQLRYTVPVYR